MDDHEVTGLEVVRTWRGDDVEVRAAGKGGQFAKGGGRVPGAGAGMGNAQGSMGAAKYVRADGTPVDKDYPGAQKVGGAGKAGYGPVDNDAPKKIAAAGGVWNPTIKGHDMPDGSVIRSDRTYTQPNYRGEVERHSVWPKGTSLWSTDQSKVRRYPSADEAIASLAR